MGGKDERIFTLVFFYLELMRELINSKTALVSQECCNAVGMSDLLLFFFLTRERDVSALISESHMLPALN